MIGAIAIAATPLHPSGQVEIRGELWQARLSGLPSLPVGAEVIVRSIDGLTLLVEPATP
jgi:membrane-bound serine protease (ClpP class)